jgi:hypothetical protein
MSYDITRATGCKHPILSEYISVYCIMLFEAILICMPFVLLVRIILVYIFCGMFGVIVVDVLGGKR